MSYLSNVMLSVVDAECLNHCFKIVLIFQIPFGTRRMNV